MNTPLARFQDEFAAALYADGDFAPATQAGFAVYRNTVISGCIDALQANFPTVERLVGSDWFREAASIFVRSHPPQLSSLMFYGEEFPGFLGRFAPAQELPYLAGVARLDLAWLQAHSAMDEPPLSAQDLAGLGPAQLGALRLRPHASARWTWFEAIPVYSIWDANRRQQDPSTLEWRAEGALLLRPADSVRWLRLDETGYALLEACRQGQPLEAALALASEDMDAGAGAFRSLLDAGAFANNTQRRDT